MVIRFLDELIEKDTYENYVGYYGDDYFSDPDSDYNMLDDDEKEKERKTAEEFYKQLKANDAEYLVYARLYSFSFIGEDSDEPHERYLLVFRDYDSRQSKISAAIGDAGDSVLTYENRQPTDFSQEPSMTLRYYFGKRIDIEWSEEKPGKNNKDIDAERIWIGGESDDDVIFALKEFTRDCLRNCDDSEEKIEKNLKDIKFIGKE